MVEYTYSLDNIFHSLSDVTRRDILARVCRQELTISGLAEDYDMSFSAVAKHLKVLEKAQLIVKRKRGKEKIITANPDCINEATHQLDAYRRYWNERYDALDELLKREG
jgi:DNA-binding transcriptional ArsR family regulator